MQLPAQLIPTPFRAAALTGVVLFAALCGAWFFQYVVGLAPCALCFKQREPYYVGIPAGLLLAGLIHRGMPGWGMRAGLLVLLGICLWSATLGVYHSGVEWKLWAGPTDCAGVGGIARIAGDLLSQLATTKIVPCDEAAWRLFGLSLAGYNALISGALALYIALALRFGSGIAHGSSSVSQ